MAANNQQFLVSVCDVQLRDTTADLIVLKGKTLISSALNQTMNSQEVRGGFGNALQYVYNFEKKLDVTIEDCRFDETYMAISNGTSIVSAAKPFYVQDEVVTLSSGSGTVSGTPVGNVYVQKADNSLITVTPTGSTFAVSGGGNTTVKVSYRATSTVDYIEVSADGVPAAYELTMTAKIFNAAGQSAVWQCVIPQFKVSGNFSLEFTASGVSTSKLDGMALINPSDNAYAYVYIKPIAASTASYQAIAAIPSTMSLSTTTTTSQITVYGVRGGIYANTIIPAADCTYVSGTTATCTVNSSGLVTRVAAGTSLITVTHTATGIKDYIQVTSA